MIQRTLLQLGFQFLFSLWHIAVPVRLLKVFTSKVGVTVKGWALPEIDNKVKGV
jgi:hypothetical protein